jgi:hypothetical protein
MSHTEIHEAADGSITVTERPDEQERHEQSLERLVIEIRDDTDATATEKRLASALIALKESQ